MNFKGKVSHCEFSPCGRSFAVCVGKLVQIWATPTMLKEFAPFRLLRTYGGMYDEATCLAWSPDSRWIIVGSKDLTARIYSANHMEGYVPPTLAGHREQLCHVTFAGGGGDAAYTVSKDGALFEWRLVDEDVDGTDDTARRGDKGARGGRDSLRGGDGVAVRRWRMEGKHFFHMPAKLTCAAYHPGTGMLCAGLGHGVFTLHRLSPGGFEMVHTLSISQQKVTACQWNETGDWIGLGCARLGQVVVWEWQSEAYVYKQQGHYFDVNQCAYAPDGSMLATASDDNKVKVWSTATGSCFVTFTEHKAPVSAVTFALSGHAVVSASLDGTVRALDLMRYRNFRTLTSPEPAQFISLAVDPSGEVVCAGECAFYFTRLFLILVLLVGFFFSSRGAATTGGKDDCYNENPTLTFAAETQKQYELFNTDLPGRPRTSSHDINDHPPRFLATFRLPILADPQNPTFSQNRQARRTRSRFTSGP